MRGTSATNIDQFWRKSQKIWTSCNDCAHEWVNRNRVNVRVAPWRITILVSCRGRENYSESVNCYFGVNCQSSRRVRASSLGSIRCVSFGLPPCTYKPHTHTTNHNNQQQSPAPVFHTIFLTHPPYQLQQPASNTNSNLLYLQSASPTFSLSFFSFEHPTNLSPPTGTAPTLLFAPTLLPHYHSQLTRPASTQHAIP